MNYKKFSVILVLMILLLSMASLAQAAPPLQTPDDGSSLGETLDLDNVENTGKNNLGSIMSDKNSDDDEDEACDEATEECDDPADDGDDPAEECDDATEDCDDPAGDDEEDMMKEHPVASALADHFGVSYDEVMGLHEEGYGFGNIAKAYFFAEKLGFEDARALLEAAHGSGWGNVLKEGGIHPGSVGNGGGNKPEHAGGPKDKDKDAPGQGKKNDDAELTGQGNGNNGNGGNGNNGNGNGKDKDKGKGKGKGKGNNK